MQRDVTGCNGMEREHGRLDADVVAHGHGLGERGQLYIADHRLGRELDKVRAHHLGTKWRGGELRA